MPDELRQIRDSGLAQVETPETLATDSRGERDFAALMAKYRPKEAFVIGGDDGTVQIVSQFRQAHPSARILQFKSTGGVAARLAEANPLPRDDDELENFEARARRDIMRMMSTSTQRKEHSDESEPSVYAVTEFELSQVRFTAAYVQELLGEFLSEDTEERGTR